MTTTKKPAPRHTAPKPPTAAEVKRVVRAWAKANFPKHPDVDVTVWNKVGSVHDSIPVIRPRYTKAERAEERRQERNRIAEEYNDRLKALFAAAGGMTQADRLALLRGGID